MLFGCFLWLSPLRWIYTFAKDLIGLVTKLVDHAVKDKHPISETNQGIIQTKSASDSRALPCLVIFFRNFILIWKCQKWSLNRGTLVSATAIYQTKSPFTVLSALFSSQSALFITKKTCITLNIKTVSKHFYSHGWSSLAPQFYIVGGLIIRE